MPAQEQWMPPVLVAEMDQARHHLKVLAGAYREHVATCDPNCPGRTVAVNVQSTSRAALELLVCVAVMKLADLGYYVEPDHPAPGT